jgi:hypothetical protein
VYGKLSISLTDLNPRLTKLCRRQAQIPEEIVHKYLTCSEKSALIFSHLSGSSEAVPDEEEGSSQAHESGFDSGQDFYMDDVTGCVWGTPPTESLGECFMQDAESCTVKHTPSPSKTACPITKIADEFLDSFHNVEPSGMAVEFQTQCSSPALPENIHCEPATQAFWCCELMAVRANEQLKNATFTRFFSLCFFLIWEKLSCERGKAGARVVCTLEKEEDELATNDYPDQCTNEGCRL